MLLFLFFSRSTKHVGRCPTNDHEKNRHSLEHHAAARKMNAAKNDGPTAQVHYPTLRPSGVFLPPFIVSLGLALCLYPRFCFYLGVSLSCTVAFLLFFPSVPFPSPQGQGRGSTRTQISKRQEGSKQAGRATKTDYDFVHFELKRVITTFHHCRKHFPALSRNGVCFPAGSRRFVKYHAAR